MRLCFFGSGDDLVFGRCRITINNVFAHRPMQQGAVLLDHANRRPQTVLSNLPDDLTVNDNRALFHIIES